MSLAAAPIASAPSPTLPARPSPGAGGTGDGRPRPHLRLVTPPPSRASTWRRRIAALAVVLVVVTLLAAGIGRMTAAADLQGRVAGHVVVEPGQTLWDVAVATAPDGVDPRAQLAAIEDLNGLRATDIDAWTVVLLPAR